jgi:hypothetical protein
MSVAGLNSLTLYTWGIEEQKQKYLVPQAKGEKLLPVLTEPGVVLMLLARDRRLAAMETTGS